MLGLYSCNDRIIDVVDNDAPVWAATEGGDQVLLEGFIYNPTAGEFILFLGLSWIFLTWQEHMCTLAVISLEGVDWNQNKCPVILCGSLHEFFIPIFLYTRSRV